MSSESLESAVESSDARAWLRGALAELLLIDEVPLDQDFFSIGGNSLSAIMLAVRVHEAFDFEFPVEVLFDAEDLGDVADFIERERRSARHL
jgi:acyl carrier protein